MLKIFLFSFISSVIFTWIAMKVAVKLNILDYPAQRKMHINPKPLLGGVAVFLAFFLAVFFNFSFSVKLKGVVIGSSIMLLSGLIDDIRNLPAGFRLIIQIVCSVIVIYSGVSLNIVPKTVPYSMIMNYIITVFWIVGITNALNFMDGLDGLASGIIAIASGTFFIIACQTGQGYFAFLTISLCGACLGFLVFNFYPSKIFLGDAGSSFLGFCIASLAVMGEWASNNPIVAFSIPVLVLAILIFDVIYISISRVVKKEVKNFKEWIEYVGKDHLHHRLVKLGFSHIQAVLFIFLINITFALGALALKNAVTYQALILILQGVVILTIIVILMRVAQGLVERNGKLLNPGD